MIFVKWVIFHKEFHAELSKQIQTRSPEASSVCFSVVIVDDEHRKPGFRFIKFKEDSGLKATGIFVILLSQDGFESDSPERKS